MENFLKHELGNEFADVFIVLNEGSGPNQSTQPPVLAHMCILAARCAYFEAYFRSFLPKDRKIMVNSMLINRFWRFYNFKSIFDGTIISKVVLCYILCKDINPI